MICGSHGVELRGIEPLTFSMRTRRATNCAIAPAAHRFRLARGNFSRSVGRSTNRLVTGSFRPGRRGRPRVSGPVSTTSDRGGGVGAADGSSRRARGPSSRCPRRGARVLGPCRASRFGVVCGRLHPPGPRVRPAHSARRPTRTTAVGFAIINSSTPRTIRTSIGWWRSRKYSRRVCGRAAAGAPRGLLRAG